MYIIDETYFIDETNVPNTLELQGGEKDALMRYIDGKVRLFLQQTLGFDNFTALDSNVTSGVLNVGALQKWKNLVDGCTYVIDGTNYRWKGLKYTEGTDKTSILAHYVYCYWIKGNVSFMSGVGEIRAEAKNAINVNSTQTYVETYNEFVKMYQGACFTGNRSLYGGLIIDTFYASQNNSGYVSMVQFLKDNEADYPDCNLMEYGFKNQLGL